MFSHGSQSQVRTRAQEKETYINRRHVYTPDRYLRTVYRVAKEHCDTSMRLHARLWAGVRSAAR